MAYGRLSIIALALVALSGCNKISRSEPLYADPEPSNKTDWMEIGYREVFSLQIPRRIKEKIQRQDGSLVYVTYDTSTVKRNRDDYSVEIYSSVTSNCQNSGNDDAFMRSVLERTEYYDPENDVLIIRGVQRPTLPDVQMEEKRLQEYMKGQTTRYLFCSEHDDKGIIIIVSQVIDNPILAKGIFDTFKWIK